MKIPRLPSPDCMDPEEKAIYRKALKVGEAFIKQMIDLEGKYVADAQYEASGSQLRSYLAHVYRLGKIDGVQAAHKMKEQRP